MRELLERDDAPVIALGGGALTSEATRALRARARPVRVAGRPGRDLLAAGGRRAGRAPARERPRQPSSSCTPGASRSTARPRMRSSRGEAAPEDRAGAIAQQVWTRPGIAELALGEGAVAIADPALALARTRRPR